MHSVSDTPDIEEAFEWFCAIQEARNYPERPATFDDLSRGEQATVRTAAELMAHKRNTQRAPHRARVVTIARSRGDSGKATMTPQEPKPDRWPVSIEQAARPTLRERLAARNAGD